MSSLREHGEFYDPFLNDSITSGTGADWGNHDIVSWTYTNNQLTSLGVNPKDWLKSPQNEGDADVEGTTTIHIASGVDVSKLLDGISQLLSKAGSLGVSQTQRLPTTLTAAQKKSVEQLALERLRFLFDDARSPGAVLRAIRELPQVGIPCGSKVIMSPLAK